jgi:hypothetical protein
VAAQQKHAACPWRESPDEVAGGAPGLQVVDPRIVQPVDVSHVGHHRDDALAVFDHLAKRVAHRWRIARRHDQPRAAMRRMKDRIGDRIVVVAWQELAVQHDPSVEHLDRALQRDVQPAEEWRAVLRQEHVDVHQPMGGFWQHARHAELPRSRDDASAGSGGHAAPLVEHAIDGRRTDAGGPRNFDETGCPLAPRGCRFGHVEFRFERQPCALMTESHSEAN